MTPLRVLVAGGGVAALETCLALGALAGDRVSVTLVAPNRSLFYRPTQVRNPLAVHDHVGVAVSRIAREAGAELHRDRIIGVDHARRRARTAAGHDLPYDVLAVAVGGDVEPVPHGAEPFDSDHTAGCRALVARLLHGELESLVLAEPAGPLRAFDLYDLAIELAVALRARRRTADLTLLTPEPAPLAILGLHAAAVIGTTFGAHGVRIMASTYVRAVRGGEVDLAPGARRMDADGVIAMPRLAGPRLDGLPCDPAGFLAADLHGRLHDVEAVFAAGDCTSFPVKHASIAAQQADAVAAAIAHQAGLKVPDEPFRPVLRCLLPARLRWYVEAPLSGGHGDAAKISPTPLWPRPLPFAARFLAHALTVRTGSATTGAATTAMVTP